MIELNNHTFDEFIELVENPVVVDFWADWCAPCRALSPILQQIADDNDSIHVVKVNVDENTELARRFNVMSLPTLIVFVDGITVKTIVGSKSKSLLLEDLKEYI